MLRKLTVNNYAIIDHLETGFSPNLNIITGETGAGKSILMGALNLVLGARADMAVVQSARKCIVEGNFEIKNKEATKFLEENDLDPSDEIVLRREITAAGKSRSFINDTPVSLAQLKEISVFLVDLHQQFDTLELSNEAFQRTVIDALAENHKLSSDLYSEFNLLSSLKNELQKLQQLQTEAEKEQDYNRFLLDELEELSLKPGELEALESELKLLSNAENIRNQLFEINYILKESESPLVQQLKVISQKLSAVAQYHQGIDPLKLRIESSLIEISDIADELETESSRISLDAERINEINERLSAGYRLLKKHSVHTTDELLQVQNILQQKLNALHDMSGTIQSLEEKVSLAEKKALTIAGKISERRKKQAKPFTDKVNDLLKQVGMPNARLKVEIIEGKLWQHGSDEILFLFDANKSNRFEPLRKVASGGELSRLMLVIKSLVATKLEMPTLIFDEIDSGISGEAARQVGNIMKELSTRHQLISITHQPQIAAKADAHYYVYKSIAGDRIQTSLKKLSNDERILAIAQMLSGEKPTDAAIRNAKEMVGN